MRLPRTSKAAIDPRRLERPLSGLAGVGPRTAGRLADLGLLTIGDLLLHVPFRHEPPARLRLLGELQPGEEAAVRATVVSANVRSTRRRRLTVLEALVRDASGNMVAVWYNQDYLKASFADHPEVLLRGQLVRRSGMTSFVVKSHEIIGSGEEGVHTLGLVPVYPATGELSVRTIRGLLSRAAPEAAHLVDPLPAALLAERRYARKPDALVAYHFPASMADAKRARDRLAFEELLLLQVALLRRRQQQDRRERSRPLGASADLVARFLADLPFAPTGAQQRAVEDIDRDLARDAPMRRLLQGDVGSGKTMVATYALLRAVETGGQAALMAPTEVLADQHAARLQGQLAPLGVPVGLLKGSQGAAERRETTEALADGRLPLVVGTHALIQQGLCFQDLRVAVVDEQHRFGVRQREALAACGPDGLVPHVLHMTATPIPRTLSLTLYGDLDLTVIDELPPGRRPVRTRLVEPEDRARMWTFVRAQLQQGRQAYVVCPLVEESDVLAAASARATFDDLSAGELRGFRLRLLHGQLPTGEKQAAMAAFAGGEADVLVSTTVIEVGVDVANATVMVIEGANRFGLSQLHQLRGRVGRGSDDSYCLLLADGADPLAHERLELFSRTTDGFRLAEADLRARGEGQIFGERQSGWGDLRIARLLRDGRLLEEARSVAAGLLAADPDLADPRHRLLADAVEASFGEQLHWLDRV